MIYVDITEIISNPVRSGIQRVVRELVHGLPPQLNIEFCFFDDTKHNLRLIPQKALQIIAERDGDTKYRPVKEIREELRAIVADSEFIAVPDAKALFFIPEVFFERNRLRHHRWRMSAHGSQVALMVYDFIPWVRPDLTRVENMLPIMPYLKFTQEIAFLAADSEEALDDWRTLIIRDRERPGAVISLGADRVGICKQNFSRERRALICVGSIDGRKMQEKIVEAFAPLWEQGMDLGLILVGYPFDVEDARYKYIKAAEAQFEQLEVHEHATDAELDDLMARAVAGIYLSEKEGYGLPPLEYLQAGLPVIVSDVVPSVRRLASKGQIRVVGFEVSDIQDAIELLTRPGVKERLWREAAEIDLPTWRGFCEATGNWLRSCQSISG